MTMDDRSGPPPDDVVGHVTDHVAVNRDHWDRTAPGMVAAAERLWATDRITWGMWDVPEAEVRLLGNPPLDLTGRRAVELGCGTGYVSG
jgi:hypothetical protein